MPDILLSKQLSNSFKGVAVVLVLTAHCAQWYTMYASTNTVIGLMTKLGRYGVSIFFMVSGYGLVCSAERGIDRNFFIRRLRATYIPYIIIEIIAFFLKGVTWNLKRLSRLLLGMEAWFITVIMLFYILFYLGWKYSKHKILVIETGICIISILLAVIFKDSLWYSSNIAFGIGIIVKVYEKRFITFISKGWGIKTILLMVWFICSGVIYMFAMDRNQIRYVFFKIMAAAAWVVLLLALSVKGRRNQGNLLGKLGKISLECYLIYPYVFDMSVRSKLPMVGTIVVRIIYVLGLSCLWHFIYGMFIKRQQRGIK